MHVVDIIILALMIASAWSLVVIPLKIHVIWRYWITLILPMALMLSIGVAYFGILQWIGKLMSN